MTFAEKFRLKWDDFQQNISNSFKELRHDHDFTDVTLVCENKKLIEVHKIVLSVCSPIFRDMLKQVKYSNPII